MHSSPLTDSIASVSMRPPTLVGNSFDDRVQLWLGHLRAGTTQRDILELFREERIEVLETVVRTRVRFSFTPSSRSSRARLNG